VHCIKKKYIFMNFYILTKKYKIWQSDILNNSKVFNNSKNVKSNVISVFNHYKNILVSIIGLKNSKKIKINLTS